MLIESMAAFGILVALWLILPVVGHGFPISGGSEHEGED